MFERGKRVRRGAAVGTGALMLCAAAIGSTMLNAQQPRAQGGPRVCDPQKSLGVSRVVEIDTAQGGRYGHQQYQDIDFLKDGEIVLTFDDGPLRPHSQPVLDALEAQCTKATFFMVGTQALADPDMVKRIQRHGHTIGTHTWSHANLRKLTPLKARNEIEMGFSGVQAAAGQPIAPFFRFPFLADTKSMMGYAGTRSFGIFSIEVDAYDYKTKEPKDVHQAVLNQLATRKKGIVLFHDIQPATAQALPGLLAALRQRGYKVVHLKPKSFVTTMPEFDQLAQREAQRKRIASASNPLASRAVTWPNSGAAITAAGPPLPPGLDAKGATATAQAKAKAAPTAADPNLPWSKQAAGPAAPSPTQPNAPPLVGAQGVAVPQPQKLPRRPQESDWRTTIFTN